MRIEAPADADAMARAVLAPRGRIVGSSHHVRRKTFGASAPPKPLQEKFGIEPERVGASAKEFLDRP